MKGDTGKLEDSLIRGTQGYGELLWDNFYVVIIKLEILFIHNRRSNS